MLNNHLKLKFYILKLFLIFSLYQGISTIILSSRQTCNNINSTFKANAQQYNYKVVLKILFVICTYGFGDQNLRSTVYFLLILELGQDIQFFFNFSLLCILS